MALLLPELCFLCAKTRENLNLFRWLQVLDMVLKGSSDINEGKGKTSHCPHCVGKYSCISNWNELFSSVGQVLGGSFFVMHFDGNVYFWIPKLF